jgi:putative aldouronate transport system substrate-binding protein
MKKIATLLVCLALVMSAVLTACSSDNGKDDNAENKSGDANVSNETSSTVTPAGTYPITEERVTLDVLVVGHARVEDFNTNDFTKWYEEKTNVDIQFEVVPPEGAETKLNLILAGGELPDIIFGFNLSPSQLMIYGKQGIFVDLKPLIDKYGDNTKKMFADLPQVEKALTAPDGSIYALPQVNACYHCSMPHKAWIYKPWLDALGLDVPTTTEEFYEVLKAFKTRDPNGNGAADEIPFATAPVFGGGLETYIMNAFVYSNNMVHHHLILNDGKIEAAYVKPEWRQGLEYLHKLYAEGLIAPESFTMNADQFKALSIKNDEIVLGVGGGSGAGRFFPTTFGEDRRWADYIALEPLEGPNGMKVAAWNPYPISAGVNWSNFIITGANEHPEISFRWADGLYEQEATLRAVFGVEGEHWVWHGSQNPDKIGMNGEPALWERLVNMNQGVQNSTWQQIGISYRSAEFWAGETADMENNLDQVILYRETARAMEPYKQPVETIVPPLFYTEEQASQLADLSTTIEDYMMEMFARFVTGDADIDKEWDNYLATLEKMNLKQYLQIKQDAYDAQMK